jgi:hypothetical protein
VQGDDAAERHPAGAAGPRRLAPRESHGYYAAVELAGAAEILAMASATGRLIPARLRLEQREKKEPGKPTKKWAVPIIEFVETRIGSRSPRHSADR